MESAGNLVAIVEAFFNALKNIFNAIKSLFSGLSAEDTTAAAE